MEPRRLVLMVEGEGDVAATRVMVRRLLTEIDGWKHLFLDKNVFRVGGIECLTGRKHSQWQRYLSLATKRKDLGGVLLLLDGDADHVHGDDPPHQRLDFCAMSVAQALARKSREVGGGSLFSVACVFARQEFESWFLAGISSLREKLLPNGLKFRSWPDRPPQNTDESPRDAKRWLSEHIQGGYKQTIHQEILARHVDPQVIRAAGSRSFHRLESALVELCRAVQDQKHVATPTA